MTLYRIFRRNSKGKLRPIHGLLYTHRTSAMRAIKRIRQQLRVVAVNVR